MSSRCRSTSASAAPCRPASATPGQRATSSRSASTATASTIRRELGPLLDAVVAGRGRRLRSARASPGADGYRSSATRRIGIRVLAAVSLLTAQRLTDTTSGFQALNRRAIELFAADYPHDYPEVEGP